MLISFLENISLIASFKHVFVFPNAVHRADVLLFDWETDELTVIYVDLVATSSTFQIHSLPDNIIITITV